MYDLRFDKKRHVFEDLLHKAGLQFSVTQGYRSMAEQAALYAKGRTKPGPKVTNAKPGQSAHNYGMAADYIPVVNGKRTYNVSAVWWIRFGLCAKKAGLIWGGTFKKLLDRPHVELPDWKKLI